MHLDEEVLKAVPIRHWTFTILKMLWRVFRNDRALLRRLCACANETLRDLYLSAIRKKAQFAGQ